MLIEKRKKIVKHIEKIKKLTLSLEERISLRICNFFSKMCRFDRDALMGGKNYWVLISLTLSAYNKQYVHQKPVFVFFVP